MCVHLKKPICIPDTWPDVARVDHICCPDGNTINVLQVAVMYMSLGLLPSLNLALFFGLSLRAQHHTSGGAYGTLSHFSVLTRQPLRVKRYDCWNIQPCLHSEGGPLCLTSPIPVEILVLRHLSPSLALGLSSFILTCMTGLTKYESCGWFLP